MIHMKMMFMAVVLTLCLSISDSFAQDRYENTYAYLEAHATEWVARRLDFKLHGKWGGTTDLKDDGNVLVPMPFILKDWELEAIDQDLRGHLQASEIIGKGIANFDKNMRQIQQDFNRNRANSFGEAFFSGRVFEVMETRQKLRKMKDEKLLRAFAVLDSLDRVLPKKWNRTYGEEKASRLLHAMKLHEQPDFVEKVEERLFQEKYLTRVDKGTYGYDSYNEPEGIERIKKFYDTDYFEKKYYNLGSFPSPGELMVDETYNGRLFSLRFLLHAGMEVNAADDEGNTALHTICFRYDGPEALKILEFLLENGADPFQENKAGITPYEVLLHPKKKNLLFREK